jgi:hypothetical protein
MNRAKLLTTPPHMILEQDAHKHECKDLLAALSLI